jgi:biofilm PGA synthesis lipoprotein PgaB
MAMPYMEQVDNADQFYKDMIDRVKKYPNGIKKTVLSYKQQTGVTTKVPSTEMAATIHSLYQQGAMHVAYYPDDPIKDHPDVNVMHKAFAEKSSRLSAIAELKHDNLCCYGRMP